MKLRKEHIALTALELKNNGFKKKANNWSRVRGELVDVINIQVLSSDSDSLTFVVNVGVFSERIHGLLWGEPKKGQLNEADCIIRFRLLAPEENSGNQFVLHDGVDVRNFDEKLKYEVTCQALNILDELTDISEIDQNFSRFEDSLSGLPLAKIQRSLLKYISGDEEEGFLMLDEIEESAPVAFKNKVKEVKSRIIQSD